VSGHREGDGSAPNYSTRLQPGRRGLRTPSDGSITGLRPLPDRWPADRGRPARDQPDHPPLHGDPGGGGARSGSPGR